MGHHYHSDATVAELPTYTKIYNTGVVNVNVANVKDHIFKKTDGPEKLLNQMATGYSFIHTLGGKEIRIYKFGAREPG